MLIVTARLRQFDSPSLTIAAGRTAPSAIGVPMAFLDMIKEDAERVLANTDEFGIAISYTPYKGSAISTSAVPVGFAPDKDNTTPRGQIKITLWHIPRSKVTARPVEDGDSFTEGGRTHVVKEIVDDRDPAMWTVRTS